MRVYYQDIAWQISPLHAHEISIIPPDSTRKYNHHHDDNKIYLKVVFSSYNSIIT